MRTMRKPALIALATASAMLIGCGGGGDDDDLQAADKYAGIWDIPCASVGGQSGNATIVLNKTGTNTLTGTSTLRIFSNPACSGAPAQTQDFPASVTIDGTGSASGRTVDKVTEASLGETIKDIFLVEGNRLYSSPEDAPVDAQGYPTMLDLSNGAVRR